MRELLSPKSDYIFKKIFGDPGNTPILKKFLQAVLDLPASEYHRITVADPHTLPFYSGDKLGIMDVKLETTSGKVIDIEIQTFEFPDMRERMVFYLSRMVDEQIKQGEEYFVIQQAITILITDHILIKENDAYHNRYRLYDKNTGSEFTDLLEVDTLELPKLPQKEDGSDLWNWMKFLQAEKEADLTMIKGKDEQLDEAVVIVKKLSADEQARLEEEYRMKALRDHNSIVGYAKREAKRAREAEENLRQAEENLRQAEEKTKKETAKNLLQMQMPIEQIAQATGLSIEIIQNL